MQTVTLIQGGGVGFDQQAAVERVLAAAEVPIRFDVHLAGRAALEAGLDPLPATAFAAVKATCVALKTKLLQPLGAGTPTAHGAGSKVPTNYNVEFRRRLGLFASVRPVRNLRGLPSRFTGVNFLLVREITEDLYATTEHEIVPGVVQSFKIVTEAACLRFFRFAFELARKSGRKTVHCIHKANILKQADGLYLDCFRRTAAEFPEIAAKDMIVDNACMQMVSRPTQFDVVAAGNLYGDLLGDLGAGLIGGIAATSAVNRGPDATVYEAVFGAGHERVPPGQANPLPLLLPTVELLRDTGHATAADRILAAIEEMLTEGKTLTADLGGTASTHDFAAAIAAKLAK